MKISEAILQFVHNHGEENLIYMTATYLFIPEAKQKTIVEKSKTGGFVTIQEFINGCSVTGYYSCKKDCD